MIRSMTGFAGTDQQFDFGRLVWELRSVNHRYLELGLRLPEEFRTIEGDIRQLMGEFFARGKIDAALRFTPSRQAGGSKLVLNEPMGRQLLELHAQISGLCDQDEQPRLMSVLRWPGVVEEQPPDPAPLHEAAMKLLGETARKLQNARGREGDKLAQALHERLDGIERWVAQIRQWLPEIREALRTKMIDRVGELQQPLDPGRLEQEVAFLAQKIDVDEELDRLDAHVSEARRILELEEPVGRRLDFLMQEFNREANTLSAKSVDQRTTQAAVELKVLVEQMREQTQNIE